MFLQTSQITNESFKIQKKDKNIKIENFFEQKLDNKNINLINIEYKFTKAFEKAQKI